ncbi:hypothetical protein J8M20_09880 [Pseudoalteromonas luteoviolacea]|uniref:hypothetical protein n=1 Tax=Pseudoalteromonas luteoviolacea TaxID=43657 RepID=UPI001B375235|nr:hypothetical protein [Pseudoalteromonas luteoviolacea]MBQ4811648.1 hypothetical protein [Pseudoalteromonas luteoviolacea]
MIDTTLKSADIPSPLWDIYKDVYFAPFSATHHYLNGAIISLWNPNGKSLNNHQNSFFAKKNISLISRQQISINYLYGGNENMSYREFSISINTSLANAQKIAQRCRQNAFYYLSEGQITLYNSMKLTQYCRLNAHFLSRLCRTSIPKSNAAISKPTFLK